LSRANAAPAVRGEARHPVEDLAERYWDRYLELHPVEATLYGDERFDDRLDDTTPAGREAFRALNASTLEDLDDLRETGTRPTGEAAVTEAVLRSLCTVEIGRAHV